jgi:hypothetical protein
MVDTNWRQSGYITNAMVQFNNNSDGIEEVVKRLMEVMGYQDQFKSVELIGMPFREKGAVAQIYASTNQETNGDNASIHIHFYQDGSVKVSRSKQAKEGGQENSQLPVWHFMTPGKVLNAPEIIEGIFMRIGALDEGFAKYMQVRPMSAYEPASL